MSVLHPDTLAQMEYERRLWGISFIIISDEVVADFDPLNHARIRGIERDGDTPVVKLVLTRDATVEGSLR